MNGLDRIVMGVVLGTAVMAAGCGKDSSKSTTPEKPAKDAATQPAKSSSAGKSAAQAALAAANSSNQRNDQPTKNVDVENLPPGVVPMNAETRQRLRDQRERSLNTPTGQLFDRNGSQQASANAAAAKENSPAKADQKKNTPQIDPSLADPANLPGDQVRTAPTATPSGLQFYELEGGTGAVPANSTSRVTVHYTGYLPGGKKFDSSVDRGRPSTFALNGVIPGWTEGVGSMRVGGKRKLVIPAELAYGEAGRPPKIPGNATLVFDIELIQVHDTVAHQTGPNNAVVPVTASKPENQIEPASTEVVLQVTPDSLDLGDVASKQLGSAPVKLTNISNKPITIERAKTSCGCTTTDFVPNTVLQPGESSEITINLRGGTRAAPLSKTVTFMVKDAAPVKMQVSLNTVFYVELSPDEYDNVLNPDGSITLRAIDDQPFSIVSMSPPIISEFDKNEAVEHKLTMPWEDYWNNVTTTGGGKNINIHTTHPLAEQVTLRVKLDPDGRARLNDIIKDRVQKRVPGVNNQPQPGSDRNELSALVKRGDVDRLQERLDEGADIDTRGKSGVTLLGQAAQAGNVEIVELLIDSGADLELSDQVGRTPLMSASQSKSADVTRALLEAGADVRARDPFVGNALSWHAAFGSADSVQELVDYGSDVEVVSDQTGFTPIVWAAGFGDSNSVTILLDAGARLDVTDVTDGSTALHHAAKTGSAAHVQALVDGKANLSSVDRNGKTPLHAAAGHRNGNVEKIKILVEAGSDVNAKDNRGLTPLDIAKTERADSTRAAVVKYLESVSDSGSQEPTEEPTTDDSGGDSGSE